MEHDTLRMLDFWAVFFVSVIMMFAQIISGAPFTLFDWLIHQTFGLIMMIMSLLILQEVKERKARRWQDSG